MKHAMMMAVLLGALACGLAQEDLTLILEPVPEAGSQAPAPDAAPAPAASEVGVVQPGDASVAPNASAPAAFSGGSSAYMANGVDANKLFRALARKGGFQFFDNPALAGITVSGRVNVNDPKTAIRDLAAAHNLLVYDSGDTLFVRTVEEMEKMPLRSASYRLQYLRQENIEALVLPMLTPNRGSVKLDTKTNMLMIQDNDYAINNVMQWLKKVDQPQRQVNLQLTFLRIQESANMRFGIDWESTLGAEGYSVSLGTANSLRSLLNFGHDKYSPPNSDGEAILPGAGGGNLGNPAQNGVQAATETFTAPTAAILQPGAITVVMRALKERLGAEEIASPNLVLEDNEPGLVAIVDRYPIVEFQPAEASSGSDFISLSSEIRYKIDKEDPVPSATDPGREIGVSFAVTPTLLPDGTIRVKVAPRTASISEFISVPTGSDTPPNIVPRVAEARSTSTLRVPDGYSAILGGFYAINKSVGENKVPVLGDLPFVGWVFKSRETIDEKTRLLFILTAASFDASCVPAVTRTERRALEPAESPVELPSKRRERIRQEKLRGG